MITSESLSALGRRSCLMMLAACATLPMVGCTPELPDYRYRLSVEVDTPDGVRSGSSVIQVASHVSSKYSLAPGDVTNQVTGEAVVVNLPGGKTLFALLSKPGSAEGASAYALDALISKPWVGWKEYVADVSSLKKIRDVGVLPPKDWPMLVTFGDINDPTTVMSINPDDLVSHFGTGVKIRRITVQVTQDPITSELRSRLAWIGTYPEPALKSTNDMNDYSISATLRHGDFLRVLRE
ncbi:MAG: hypothetical protein JHD35_17200 [Sphingopyxis sp.]|nr:hypothetical protein [Sphingopyxis sp.]